MYEKQNSFRIGIDAFYSIYRMGSQCSTIGRKPDKEQMIKEVKALVDKLVQGCETANADEVLGVLANSPEFSYVVNRQYSTYPEFEKGLKGWFEMITGQKLTVENERFSFPFFNSVLYTADLGIVMVIKRPYSNNRSRPMAAVV
jgi:hypothetical protein